MSERNDSDLTNQQDPSRERVGDILRKERITRRITIETIAKDLKLNVKFIKALEASEYESLPADPYVRVYLRSLAKYLSLDPDEILKKFYLERGMNIDQFSKDSSSKLHVSMKDKEEYRSPMLIVAIVLIVLLGGFSFLANKKGWISAPNFKVSSAINSTASDSLIDSLFDDSLFAGPPEEITDSIGIADSVADTTGVMRVRLDVTADSVWVQVFSDGESWKNIIFKNQTREFAARDSFNIHVGNNSIVKYQIDGKPVKVRGTGVVAFKIDQTGKPIVWTLSRWNTVFKNRL